MKSDLVLDTSKFAPENVPESTKKVNESILKLSEGIPQWWEVGAPKYREMRERGETGVKPRPQLPYGKNITIPSREQGRGIPCRVMPPTKAGIEPRGIFIHIHGGGWVLGSETAADPLLSLIANASEYIVISVGYRLAPEHPYPKPVEDCYDVAEYLFEHGKEQFGAEIKMVGGDSAGGHLSFFTALHMLEKYPGFEWQAIVFSYGVFSLNFLPTAYHLENKPILSRTTMDAFNRALIQNWKDDNVREASPFYRDLRPFRGRLPKALFIVGTEDILLDDSVMMSAKWQMAGAEGILRVVPGAAHGFLGFPHETVECAREGGQIVVDFLQETVARNGIL